MYTEYIKKRVKDIEPWLIEVRREFHKYPELSLNEYNTKNRILNYLKEMNIEYTEFEKHNGVMAYIIKPENKITIGIRADMDALPINEENEITYKSKNKGVMHACGHDAHIAMLLGACKILNDMKDELYVNVKFLFQPAEETVGGAKFLVEDGCMKNPDVDYMFGLHVMPYLETGYIETKYNILNASADSLKIIIKGKKSHGAYPESGKDAIVVASNIILSLQSIVSRNISPLDSVVLTIGKIRGGEAQNIICEEVSMNGTLRTINKNTRKEMIKRIENIVLDICRAFDCEGEVLWERDGYPPVVNDNYLVDIVVKNTEKLFGKDRFILKEKPSLGGEDFSYYLEECKGAFYHIGCRHSKQDITQLHTSTFNIDEECLVVGTLMHILNVLHFNSN
ncbi:M20 metallopeptidase family protein [Romboutsia sp. 1001713B170131_170501_G6]|uniref:M20 metallopeptidase family protein n=1 Tax=Romboutsia sp. 1001713B170131_170501_G6 TaxID=2787108 RepID=UPI0018AA8DFA|nr:M20 family metallopeptidase [Romboutsia sp. 1001713B170131_170501_G6]